MQAKALQTVTDVLINRVLEALQKKTSVINAKEVEKTAAKIVEDFFEKENDVLLYALYSDIIDELNEVFRQIRESEDVEFFKRRQESIELFKTLESIAKEVVEKGE